MLKNKDLIAESYIGNYFEAAEVLSLEDLKTYWEQDY
jgi:hypothetical protein